jgi:SnoaL-like domain
MSYSQFAHHRSGPEAGVAFTSDDRIAIADVIAMHGHLFDEGELDRLDELFTPQAVYDVSDFGQEPMRGIAAIREAALALGDRNPVAHHVTNVVVTPVDENTARVRSKGLGVTSAGSVGSVTYLDTVERTPAGWRISHRRVEARRRPLNDAMATQPE